MKSILKHTLPALALSTILIACKKDDNTGGEDIEQLKTEILSDAATVVIVSSYEDMFTKATALSNAVSTLIATTNDANLNTARQAWKDMRTTWEQTEAWLFGPVDFDDIDPRIDTWPVDFTALDGQLTSGNAFTEEYITELPDDLKGFHPIEYLLWGQNGNKTAASFTAREKEYLSGLASNLKKLSESVKNSWANGYANTLKTAGASGNSDYPTQQSAFVEIADAMAGICGEVANEKMKGPFEANDPSQEESPFAKNSITDFTNNIQGILKMYQGNFSTDGKGLEDLVRNYNLSLDNEIKAKHTAAIAALQGITVPFGEAISTQQTQVQNAMNKINDLASTLDEKLKPFVLQYIK
ncbi:MAG: hypothetical protein JNL51_02300 [Chitinophagaceae bacterium]|nr:hypothetical protein [Chitinophagaceae bacterium]